MKDTGGPAFPTLADNGHEINQDGMTLRDYFAAKAMQAAWDDIDTETDRYDALKRMAFNAYAMADAMLKAR